MSNFIKIAALVVVTGAPKTTQTTSKVNVTNVRASAHVETAAGRSRTVSVRLSGYGDASDRMVGLKVGDIVSVLGDPRAECYQKDGKAVAFQSVVVQSITVVGHTDEGLTKRTTQSAAQPTTKTSEAHDANTKSEQDSVAAAEAKESDSQLW